MIALVLGAAHSAGNEGTKKRCLERTRSPPPSVDCSLHRFSAAGAIAKPLLRPSVKPQWKNITARRLRSWARNGLRIPWKNASPSKSFNAKDDPLIEAERKPIQTNGSYRASPNTILELLIREHPVSAARWNFPELPFIVHW